MKLRDRATTGAAVTTAALVESCLLDLSVTLRKGSARMFRAYAALATRITGGPILPGLPVRPMKAHAMDGCGWSAGPLLGHTPPSRWPAW